MNIVLTGGTSFTGYWFAARLVAAGHRVWATLTRDVAAYEGLRRIRVNRLATIADIVENSPFGSPPFLELLAHNDIDVLCHHASNTKGYRSIDFDALAAVRDDTLNLKHVLRVGCSRRLRAVVLTGTVFEAHEGVGSPPLRAFSPYGLSKVLTYETFRFWCHHVGIALAKFVIPNPFGPWEEPRFTDYLVRSWSRGEIAVVNTPSYVRDNIHVSLLAAAYVNLIGRLAELPIVSRFGPSGYVETQGSFARRFATEIGSRLQLETRLQLVEQTEFPEPPMRINTDFLANFSQLGWNESGAWDSLADYYREIYLFPARTLLS